MFLGQKCPWHMGACRRNTSNCIISNSSLFLLPFSLHLFLVFLQFLVFLHLSLSCSLALSLSLRLQLYPSFFYIYFWHWVRLFWAVLVSFNAAAEACWVNPSWVTMASRHSLKLSTVKKKNGFWSDVIVPNELWCAVNYLKLSHLLWICITLIDCEKRVDARRRSSAK